MQSVRPSCFNSNLPDEGPLVFAPQVVAEDGSIGINSLQVIGPSDMAPGSGPLSIFKSKPQPSPEEEGLAQVSHSSLLALSTCQELQSLAIVVAHPLASKLSWLWVETPSDGAALASQLHRLHVRSINEKENDGR